MVQKGLLQTIILVVVVIVVIVTVYLLRSLYERNLADFGTWSDFQTTICDNGAQGCTVAGISHKYRTCTPNARTGYGCIDSKGKHTYKDEKLEVKCNPPCYSAIWSGEQTSACEVYDDLAHTTLASNQTCKNPPQFTYQRNFKTCIPFDSEGPVACVRIDGNLANVGDTEEFFRTCDTIPDCYPGTWQPCPSPVSVVNEYCGGTVAQCGEVIPTTTSGVCAINDVPVASSNCYPPDNPGPCPRTCFNYPCDATWPAGFTNVNGQLGGFVEVFESVNGLVPDWLHVVIACGANPIATNNASANIVITTPTPHGIPVGEFVAITGVAGTVNGIAATKINGFRQVTAVTSTTLTFVADGPATSTGVGGGTTVQLEQDPQGAAQAQQDVYNSFGPVTLKFAPSVAGERVRIRIVPSQAEVPSGAFYMLCHLPYNGQTGIVSWNGSALVVDKVPILTLGQTLDDVVPRPDLFKFTETTEPQFLHLYTLPGPVLTPLFCAGPGGCLTFSTCDGVVYDVLETCV
jgi:hypothetical protein